MNSQYQQSNVSDSTYSSHRCKVLYAVRTLPYQLRVYGDADPAAAISAFFLNPNASQKLVEVCYIQVFLL